MLIAIHHYQSVMSLMFQMQIQRNDGCTCMLCHGLALRIYYHASHIHDVGQPSTPTFIIVGSCTQIALRSLAILRRSSSLQDPHISISSDG